MHKVNLLMTRINYTEKIVYEWLREYIMQHPDEFCTCTRCVDDIMALALNKLPPRYVVSHVGEVITDFNFTEAPDRTKVMTEVIRAVRTVSKNPSHP